jgi:1,4-alpha-glucan branching enzyme
VNAVDVGFWGAGTERDYVERNDFVFVGRLIPTKGVGLLLEAFSELRQEHSEARLHVIGDGEERHRVARGARGDPHVVYTGPLTGRALQERLATARFLVVPSLGDTWAIVVAEAMAAGTPPIVSSATGAAWGLVRNGVNGFVFEAGRREALTAALSRAWALDAAEWSAMSRNAREAVEKEDVSSFAASVGAALRMGRRTSAPSRASRLMTRLWSGHGIGPR